MEDEPEQEALFYIEGPDERGCVRMHGTSSRDPWAQKLGPADKVAEVLSQWLGSIYLTIPTRSRTPWPSGNQPRLQSTSSYGLLRTPEVPSNFLHRTTGSDHFPQPCKLVTRPRLAVPLHAP